MKLTCSSYEFLSTTGEDKAHILARALVRFHAPARAVTPRMMLPLLVPWTAGEHGRIW